MIPQKLSFQPKAVYIRKTGTTTAAAGTIRIESRINMRKFVPRGLKREKLYAARKDMMIATVTANAEMRKLFCNEEKKSCRDAKSVKLARVGEKTHLGGIASTSLFVLKAARIIHRTGRKNMAATSQRIRWYIV